VCSSSRASAPTFPPCAFHRDAPAADSARAVNAHAYAVGHHIVFATNQYAPGGDAGRHLLAHELAHVVQQTGGAPPALRRQEKTVGGPLDLKPDPCISPPGLGQMCGQDAVKVCEEHPNIPGCGAVCKALGCTKKNEPKTQCPAPGAAGSHVDLARIGLGIGDELGNSLRRRLYRP
jgi:hypothetical protein